MRFSRCVEPIVLHDTSRDSANNNNNSLMIHSSGVPTPSRWDPGPILLPLKLTYINYIDYDVWSFEPPPVRVLASHRFETIRLLLR